MTTAYLLLMDDQIRQQAGKLSSKFIDKENNFITFTVVFLLIIVRGRKMTLYSC